MFLENASVIPQLTPNTETKKDTNLLWSSSSSSSSSSSGSSTTDSSSEDNDDLYDTTYVPDHINSESDIETNLDENDQNDRNVPASANTNPCSNNSASPLDSPPKKGRNRKRNENTWKRSVN